jgi:excisionase family DNA binding protein
VKRFLSVAEVAAELGVHPVTIHRAIAANEFAAIKIRGRYVIPSKVLDDMVEAARRENRVVDAAEWTVVRKERPSGN